MTSDSDENQVLHVVRTVKGNHARGRLNRREIDVIVQEVLPQYTDKGSVGIITPYRDQAEAINKILGQDIASTVHKYQGRVLFLKKVHSWGGVTEMVHGLFLLFL